MKNTRHYIAIIFLAALIAAGSSESFAQERSKTTQINTEGFFTLAEIDNHWWFVTPQGQAFFSIGLNHIDPASLRYPENIEIWEEKYNASTTEWIKESVKPNLEKWGFRQVQLAFPGYRV